ncbi:MAG: hypothetical protein LC646_08690 [Xanthomonadaceae bacterium]|nr:hypothetical protein [Xanthomonadaceae bacterium]
MRFFLLLVLLAGPLPAAQAAPAFAPALSLPALLLARNDARGDADPGLAAAAAEARRRTGGQVLSAERYPTNGETRYRIKVLTPDGRVRILNLEAR